MASRQKPRLTRTLVAGSDLSSSLGFYVKDTGTGNTAAVAGGATGEFGAGFLQNAPAVGEACEVAGVGGGALAKAGATISGPQLELMALATGKLSPATSAGDIVCAISKESAVDGQLLEVESTLYRKHA